jgi:hypothetical protein
MIKVAKEETICNYLYYAKRGSKRIENLGYEKIEGGGFITAPFLSRMVVAI